MNSNAATPTETVYSELMTAYRFFNERLFDGRLPDCLVTLQRTPGHFASLSTNRFVANDLNRFTSELSVHPGYFATQSPKETLSNLVHEMVHLEVTIDGSESSAKTPGYHSSDWGRRMNRVGLVPTDTGKPGGRSTGFRMYHYIYDGGPFDRAADELLGQGWSLTWMDRIAEEMKFGSIDVSNETPDRNEESGGGHIPPDSESSADSEAGDGARLQREDPSTTPSQMMFMDDPTVTDPGASRRDTPDAGASDDVADASLATTEGFSRVRLARKETKGGKRTKYVCSGCQCAVWGKPDLHIVCGGCEERMSPHDPKAKT